jgi:hypothetical protein
VSEPVELRIEKDGPVGELAEPPEVAEIKPKVFVSLRFLAFPGTLR